MSDFVTGSVLRPQSKEIDLVSTNFDGYVLTITDDTALSWCRLIIRKCEKKVYL